jgi:hypothetical protein
MPHILHLLRHPAHREALDVIARQAQDPAVRLSIVLLHDAAAESAVPRELPGAVYRLGPARSGDRSSYPVLTHDDLLSLIFVADSVITW